MGDINLRANDKNKARGQPALAKNHTGSFPVALIKVLGQDFQNMLCKALVYLPVPGNGLLFSGLWIHVHVMPCTRTDKYTSGIG